MADQPEDRSCDADPAAVTSRSASTYISMQTDFVVITLSLSFALLSKYSSINRKYQKTWTLRMHCNLRPPEPRQPFPALITTPCQVWSRWTYPLPYYSVFCCWYITFRCDLDLWPLTLNICRLSPVKWYILCTKFERNRAIRGRVNAISIFDLTTLNMLRVALDSGIIFTMSDLRQLIRAWIIG